MRDVCNRYLDRLKFHVHNKVVPEGSVVEGYLLEELLIFCSSYLESAETIFSRPYRNLYDYKGEVVDVCLNLMLWTQAVRARLAQGDKPPLEFSRKKDEKQLYWFG